MIYIVGINKTESLLLRLVLHRVLYALLESSAFRLQITDLLLQLQDRVPLVLRLLQQRMELVLDHLPAHQEGALAPLVRFHELLQLLRLDLSYQLDFVQTFFFVPLHYLLQNLFLNINVRFVIQRVLSLLALKPLFLKHLKRNVRVEVVLRLRSAHLHRRLEEALIVRKLNEFGEEGVAEVFELEGF